MDAAWLRLRHGAQLRRADSPLVVPAGCGRRAEYSRPHLRGASALREHPLAASGTMDALMEARPFRRPEVVAGK
jgi:hypothetical protein